MSSFVRGVFFSPLGVSDTRFATVLSSLEDGGCTKQFEGHYWRADGQQHNCCVDNNGEHVDNTAYRFLFEAKDSDVGIGVCNANRSCESDIVNSCSKSIGLVCEPVRRMASCGTCDFGNCTCGGICHDSVQNGGFDHTKISTRNVELDEVVVGDVSKKLGVNTLRNRANRAAQRARKLKRKSMNQDWRKREVVKTEIVRNVNDDSGDVKGFWNSCPESVRQELIESKARMHIAENKRREQEARDKFEHMTSAYGVMQKCVKMAEFAQKQAEKEKDGKIYGWANTVASSSAESLARTTPSSVPSFEELSAKLEASSQSSFELELKAKDDVISDLKVRLDVAMRSPDNLIDNQMRSDFSKLQDASLKDKEKIAADKKIHDQLISKIKYLENEMIGYREPAMVTSYKMRRGF